MARSGVEVHDRPTIDRAKAVIGAHRRSRLETDGPPPVDESDEMGAVVVGAYEIAGFLDGHLVPGGPRHARERRGATVAQLGGTHPRHAATASKADARPESTIFAASGAVAGSSSPIVEGASADEPVPPVESAFGPIAL